MKEAQTTNETEHGERLLKILDIQHRLSIGRSKAYELVAKREIPGVRIGTSLRIRKEDLDRYIEENRY